MAASKHDEVVDYIKLGILTMLIVFEVLMARGLHLNKSANPDDSDTIKRVLDLLYIVTANASGWAFSRVLQSKRERGESSE